MPAPPISANMQASTPFVCVDIGSMGRMGLIPDMDHLLAVLGRTMQLLDRCVGLNVLDTDPLTTTVN